MTMNSTELEKRKSPADTFANDKVWRGPFFFVQGADPQFGMTDMWLRNNTNPETISWQEEIDAMRRAVADINRMSVRPEFFVICGDLVHEFECSSLKLAQERDFLEEVNKVHQSIPVILIPGNHDVLNTPNNSAIEHFRSTFGPGFCTVDVRGLRCICINSQYFKAMEDTPNSEFVALQMEFLAWFDHEIERTKTDLRSRTIRHAVVFQHIPWFIVSPDEPTDYFNVDFKVRQIYLAKLIDAGIKACFCGHLHKNAAGRAGPTGELECVSTSAIGLTLGDDPSGLRIVKVLDSGIDHKFFPIGQMPTDVDLR